MGYWLLIVRTLNRCLIIFTQFSFPENWFASFYSIFADSFWFKIHKYTKNRKTFTPKVITWIINLFKFWISNQLPSMSDINDVMLFCLTLRMSPSKRNIFVSLVVVACVCICIERCRLSIWYTVGVLSLSLYSFLYCSMFMLATL